ncbi:MULTISPECIES: family 10 glycosylhydrolase [unclassified Trichocoleus]|uniref:family 10 glycosylhydrolase n=1 Tax=Funiculus sociatus TaxID=450527 RepID=UPI0016851C75|nr:family 10 glycosylhydrolase [Trichocoleus sp. FACHB-832]MBD2064147.1 family 10 glycosylhydrolase [Trichocoleus sp. FACHB-6]
MKLVYRRKSLTQASLKLPQQWRRLYRGLVAAVLTSSSLVNLWLVQPAEAQTKAYCQLSADAIAEKESLRSSALKGNPDAQTRYKALLKKHAERLQQCRSQTWPRTQAIWLRLYPCDIRQGALDELMDRLVNRGYNQVYVETFADGQVLLPVAENRTPWPSVVRTPGAEKVDLLAQAINKGHERGLKVYAWMFSMNFGYSYSQRSDRQEVLARDGKGQTSSLVVEDGSQVFIDPYNPLAKRDYYDLVQAMVRRRPDGVLFDYIRYPRQAGASSVVTKVQDLWIYGDGAREALYQRALNNKGRDLIQRYLTKGFIRAGDVAEVDKLYPQEGSPLWQGRKPPDEEMKATPGQRQPLLQWELWQLSVAHAAQGVLDFINLASQPAARQGITTGAVFFPEGNQPIGQGGYDSRIQPWDRFPASMEWHPMSYGTCGSTNCIVSQVQRVLSQAPPGTQVQPVLAGAWGKSYNSRPSLEEQMQAIRSGTPQINAVSHFAFSWQEPEVDRDRKSCGSR